MATKDQRRRQLAREKFERQQQRRTQQRGKMRRRNVVLAAGIAVVLAAGAAAYATSGLGGDAGKKDDSATATDASSSPAASDPCGEPAKGSPGSKQWDKEPALTIDASASYAMKLETTCGDIDITMDAAKAPHTVNSFAFLAGKGYFDHTKCHRLTTDGIYVLQCGDPKGTGQGGPGYTIADENLKDPKLNAPKAQGGGVYPAGTVAMANQYNAQSGKGRDTGGSQFFLVYRDSKLPPDYTPFGTITGGKDVLKKITDAGAAAPDATQNTAPNATVVIDKATVRRS